MVILVLPFWPEDSTSVVSDALLLSSWFTCISRYIDLALGSPGRKWSEPWPKGVSEPLLRQAGDGGGHSASGSLSGTPEESALACWARSTGRQQWGQPGLELFLWPTEGIWASKETPSNTDLTVESKGFPEEREQDLVGFLITWLPPLYSLCRNFLLHDKWQQS